ncbi:MAG: TauD/TfdA family dioxygenase, partial [Burkholderiaceae bacterium]
MHIERQMAACGAIVRGIDLSAKLDDATVAQLRAAWLQHQVLAFPDQNLDLDALEHFARSIGPFGIDPYFKSVP